MDTKYGFAKKKVRLRKWLVKELKSKLASSNKGLARLSSQIIAAKKVCNRAWSYADVLGLKKMQEFLLSNT